MPLRLFLFVFIVFIIKQGNGTTYNCDPNASCGCSTPSTLVTRIVGGEAVVQQSWSWAVSIRKNGNHFCGGSIISPNFILTAGHCFEKVTSLSSISILAGSLNLQPTSKDSPQVRSIAQVYIHRNYDPWIVVNDIALLRLSSPLNMKDINLKPICLPSGSTPQPPDNIDLVAVGWGKTSSGSQVVSSVLRQVTLKSVSNSTTACRSLISNSNVQFCAGVLAGGKDTCQGDSGGPLMAFVNNVWQLDGITSYGKGCALANTPGVYTRVTYYADWIQSVTSIDLSVTPTYTSYMIDSTTAHVEDETTRSNSAGRLMKAFSFFVHSLVLLSYCH